jgi:hypothetical protein
MEESLGMVMIFTIISSSMEWLGAKWEEIKTREEEAIRKKKELDDLEEKVSIDRRGDNQNNVAQQYGLVCST